MATRLFRQLKFVYDADKGDQYLLVQRVYARQSTGLPITPVTNLLLAKLYASNTKYPDFKDNGRHLQVFVANPDNVQGFSELKTYLPYAPSDPSLAAHIREIQATDPICFDYYGESSK